MTISRGWSLGTRTHTHTRTLNRIEFLFLFLGPKALVGADSLGRHHQQDPWKPERKDEKSKKQQSQAIVCLSNFESSVLSTLVTNLTEAFLK